uniref:BZIP domain-containing protein n=1 Tax=Tetraodon nigroviridis TaxID=99883 RepID=H3D2G5_TETNG
GDVLTDWMTEEVDFSSYLPNPPSPPSSTSASLPPSPLHNDIQVPSDLEVMTSLLQEELAQLEDYFLSEPLPEKGQRQGKCDRGPLPAGPQPFTQLPYASYPTSNQSESSPLLVTLATGELDILNICEQVKSESLRAGQRDLHCNFLEDQGQECLLVAGESLDVESSGRRQSCRLNRSGERKQKKRDQNKTAAHRYRQRKRAELDSLEEHLHSLEGRNRELRDKAESVEREIQYVKDLLIEVYKARSQRQKQE